MADKKPQDIPAKAKNGNHRELALTPQTVIADESNAIFVVADRGGSTAKGEACLANAVINNSAPGALLTHNRSGEYDAKFKDPSTGEIVEIRTRAGADIDITVEANKPGVHISKQQYLIMQSEIKDEKRNFGEPRSDGAPGNESSVARATKIAQDTRTCANSKAPQSLSLKKPFFTP